MRYVLDSSALIAAINGEKGGLRVGEVLKHSAMSSVNIHETLIWLERNGVGQKLVPTLFRDMISEIIPFDERQAFAAAALYPITKKHGLSLGDRACLAAAQTYKKSPITVLTADRIWKKIRLDSFEIEVIR